VRVIRDGHLDAARPGIVDDLDTRGGGGLLSVALAPGFARTGHIFVVHTATGEDGALVFRVARFREVNGTLGERAILLDGIPAAPVQPRASLRFGSDGKLYVAFDDGGGSGDRSSYSGKLLRLNADGTTPAEQASPIIGEGLRSPRGFAWSPATGRFWLADVRSDGSEQLIAGSRGYALPEWTGASAVAFLGNALIVAGTDAMLRVRFDADGETVQAVERLVEGEGLTPVRVVAVSPAGEIYFCTDTSCWVAR
jgi:glucose/arabinose dehydrogenase